MGDLKMLAEELKKAPLLRFVGEEKVWDPLKGEWVSVSVYELTIVSGSGQEDTSQDKER